MDGGPKENANPTVRSTERGRTSAKRQPLQWSQLGSFESSSSSSSGRRIIPTSAEDQAILNALIDVKRAKVTGVSLMEHAGLEIPLPGEDDNHHNYPVFHVSNHHHQSNRTAKSDQTPPAVVQRDSLTAEEVFDIVRNIQDPEHPHTLEQLGVVNLEHIEVVDDQGSDLQGALSTVKVGITPTIPHCSMATLIGLSCRVKLLRSLPPRFKVTIQIQPGTHASENAINKQLRDKERVSAALENKHLLGVVNKCIKNGILESN